MTSESPQDKTVLYLHFQGEDAIEFANRVKREIAKKGGLVDLVWDGNLKRTGVKKEWIAAQQEKFSRRIKVDQNLEGGGRYFLL